MKTMLSEAYLTHPNPMVRIFVKDRLAEGDLGEWEILDYVVGIPKKKQFILSLNFCSGFKRIHRKRLYCARLNCSNNRLVKLPQLPYCENLHCNGNNLIGLPHLPYARYIDCQENNLLWLPDLPNCKHLNCSYNRLKELPNLPNCDYLNYSNNRLTKTPYVSAHIIVAGPCDMGKNENG